MSYSPYRKPIYIRCITSLFSVFLCFTALSQNNRIKTNASLAEKIYLQLDGGVYTTNQIIWFKAIVASAANHMRNTPSGVLYVELIGPDEQIVEQKLVKITNGIGDNFFQLNENYAEGRYLVRAYTQWNKNFGNDFIFKTYIDVFPSSAKENGEAITKITLVEKHPGEFWLNAHLYPHLIDSLHRKKFKLYLSLDGEKDTLSIKGNNAGNYLLDYSVPADADLVTLTMETENGIRQSKTIALDKDLLDVQFFPESGEMVHDLMNKVGFKILNYNGKGISVEGEVVDEKGEIVSSFKSNSLGMGNFFIHADSSATYYAIIDSPSGEGPPVKYPLPKVVPKGTILSVARNNDKIRLVASSNYKKTDSVFIQVNSRGIAYYLLKGRLREGKLLASLPTKTLPDGIIAFTLLDSNKQPIAERLYFNERLENRLNIELSTDKISYNPREKTTLDIQITDSEGRAVKANLSVLVINKEQMGPIQNSRNNILSYFLLDSELRGEIEDPGTYSRKENKNRLNDLDALLLTQGWRKYNYRKPPQDNYLFLPEPALNAAGTVGGVFSKRNRKEGATLTMMTFGESQSIYTQTTDSLGRFYFNLNDEYGKEMNILIQSKNKRGKNKNFTISLDEKESPDIIYDHWESIEKLDSVVYALVEKHQERNLVEEAFEFSSGIELEEVLVEGYNMTPDRKKVMKEYGEPDVVISGKAIQEQEEKWSYGLYSVLLFRFPEDIRIQRTGGPDGYLRAHILGGEMTLVVIDGIPVLGYNYSLIPNIPPSEVRSVEIIKFADNFTGLYMDAFPQASPMDAPMTGSVIAIYTYGGKGIFGVEKPTGILQASIPVFSPSREFYTPKYENLSTQDWSKPDLRTLIHWDAQMEVDSTGSASTSFYNADTPGEMLIVVEAISEKGEIGYQEISFEIEKE